MGVVGTYTGHRRPDKLVSGSAFEEVFEGEIFLSCRKGEISSQEGRKKKISPFFIQFGPSGRELSSFSVLARSPATQRAHLTNHDHERR